MRSATPTHNSKRDYERLALNGVWALIVVLGVVLRYSHLDWDAGHALHPDELGILYVAQTIELPGNIAEFFSPSNSPLNPLRDADGSTRHYAYGHLPLYLLTSAWNSSELLCDSRPQFCQAFSSVLFKQIDSLSEENPLTRGALTARLLSAFYDSITILVSGLLARNLFNRAAGVLASAFVAFAVIHIQQSHFGTVDTLLTLLCTLTILQLTIYTKTGKQAANMLAGVFTGLALSTKASAAPLLLLIVITHLNPANRTSLPFKVNVKNVALTFSSTFLAFALTSPYAILDFQQYVNEIVRQSYMAAGRFDWPFIQQYKDTLPVLYHIVQQARWGLGLIWTAVAYTGLAYSSYNTYKKREFSTGIVVIWVLGVLLIVGSQHVKFPRYMLPITPALLVLGAGWTTQLLTARVSSRTLRYFSILLIMLPGMFRAFALQNMYAAEHTWITASEWIYAEVPPTATIAVEQWDNLLPLPFDEGQTVSLVIFDTFARPDDSDKLHNNLAALARADYLILPSSRLYGVIPRYPEEYPLSSAFYRHLFSGKLGFSLQASFTSYPVLFGATLVDDPVSSVESLPGYTQPDYSIRIGGIDESLTLYDHPTVLVFKNTAYLSASEMQQQVLRR